MSAGDFRVGIEQLDPEVTRIRLSGDFDLRAERELGQRLDSVLGEGHSKLLIDLSDATFIDSTTLGILLNLSRRLRRRQGRLAVLCPHEPMRELFRLVGHNHIFPVEETLDHALVHLGASRRMAPARRESPARAAR